LDLPVTAPLLKGRSKKAEGRKGTDMIGPTITMPEVPVVSVPWVTTSGSSGALLQLWEEVGRLRVEIEGLRQEIRLAIGFNPSRKSKMRKRKEHYGKT
jgi:hypothetical protein